MHVAHDSQGNNQVKINNKANVFNMENAYIQHMRISR